MFSVGDGWYEWNRRVHAAILKSWTRAVGRIVQAMPAVVAFGADAVDVPGHVLHGVLVRAMMDGFGGVAGAAHNGRNTAPAVFLPCPFTLHPHCNREFDRSVFATGTYGVNVVFEGFSPSSGKIFVNRASVAAVGRFCPSSVWRNISR